LFGPTCDSIDLISNEIMLPELAIGEWVYVENFGAYTVASSSNFNGFKTNVFKYIFRS
jgi:ornithine decarboxylase